MPTVAELGVTIDASGAKRGATEYEKSQKRVKNAAKQTRDELGRFQKSNKKTSDSFERMTKRAKQFAAGLLTIVAARKVLITLVDFETGLVGVGKTADLAGIELAQFGAEIIKLSRTIPVSTSKLLEIAQAAGQLGVKGTKNILLFTDTVAKLGSASDLAGAEAATFLARILNVSGEAVSEVGKLASVLVELGNNSAATEREIALITTQVAQATAAFTVSSTEAAGLSAALASLGIRAQLGASAVARAFRAIDAAIRGQGEELTALATLTGKTETEIARIFRTSNIQGFQLFIEGLGRVISVGGDATTTLAQFGLNGEEILKILPTLATKSELVAKSLKLANDELKRGTALENEAAKAFATLGSKITLLKNEFQALLLETRGQTTALGNVVDVLTQTIGLLAGFEDANSKASEQAQILAGLIKGLAIVFAAMVALKVAAWVAGVALALKTLVFVLAGASIPVLATTLVGIAALSFTGLTNDTEDLTMALGRFLELIGLIDAKAGVIQDTKDQIKASGLAQNLTAQVQTLFDQRKTEEAAEKIKEVIGQSVEDGISEAVILGLKRSVEEIDKELSLEKSKGSGLGTELDTFREIGSGSGRDEKLIALLKQRKILAETTLRLAREASDEELDRIAQMEQVVSRMDEAGAAAKENARAAKEAAEKKKADDEQGFFDFFKFQEDKEKRLRAAADVEKKINDELNEIKQKARDLERQGIDRANESIQGMFSTLEFERELIGKTNDERERAINVRELERQAIIAQVDDVEELTAVYIEQLEELQKFREAQVVFDQAGDAVARFARAGVDGFRDFNSAIEAVIRSLTELVLNEKVFDPIAKGASGFFAGLFGGGGGGAPGRVAAGPQAVGGIGPIPIRGVNRHGGITTGPELFSQNGGTGLRGENGPEAILPLLRDAQGNLGVAGGGGGGNMTTVNNEFKMNITTPNADSFRSSRTQIQRQMAAMAKPVNQNQLSGGSI